MKLLGSTESKITKDKNGENVPHLEVVELVLIHCNLVDNNHQQNSRILYTFGPNKPYVAKNLINKYGQKLGDGAKKSATDALKLASKRAIQETAEATGDLVGHTIANKITSISKKHASEPHSNATSNEISKEKYISPQERQKIIDELGLI